ncbi:MAG: alpha/beta hydrolase [Desulfobacteraceae bacterium]
MNKDKNIKKKDTYKTLLKKDLLLFRHEYESNFKSGESKPKKIGRPFLLKNKSSKTGILLIHGLMAAPEEVSELGKFFLSKGYSVYAPRLAGHGTSPEDLSTKKYTQWIDSVNNGYEVIKNICDNVIIAGFSTGAGIALYLALNYPDKYKAVVSISAPLKFKGILFNFTEIVNLWNKLTEKKTDKFKKAYVTNHPDNPEINYSRCPVSSIAEVRKMMKKVYPKLPGLSIPSLIIQAEKDPKVDGKSGKKIFSKIKHKVKFYHEVDYDKHGIVRGKITEKVFPEINIFLKNISL